MRDDELETKLRAGLTNIKDELNTLALMGAAPMWGSLIGRLDDLVEDVFGQPNNERAALKAPRTEG